MVPGDVAVEAFFIISGFYMNLILSEKYFKTRKYYTLFITNRFLRIYPIYYSVLILSLIYFLIVGFKSTDFRSLQVYIDNWKNLKLGTKIYFGVTNLSLFGQDSALFMTTTNTGTLQFTKNSFSANLPLFRFMIVPQAWTLSLELMFYIICPLFIRMKVKYIIILIIILITIKLIAIHQGLTYDPWKYRFFPFELVFFLTGIVSYHLYKELSKFKITSLVFRFILGYILFLTLFFKNLPYQPFLGLFYLVSIALTIPFLFIYTKNSKLDRIIGEFSYPFYISHILVLNITDIILKKLQISNVYNSETAFVLTTILSIFLIKSIGEKIESYRSNRIKKQIASTKILIE